MKTVRYNTFETNSSSTHSLVILSKDEYNKFEKGEIALNLYEEKAIPLNENKKIIEKDNGKIEYKNKEYDRMYDLLEEKYNEFDDGYAIKEYVYAYAEVTTKEVGDKIAMSIYREER